MTLRWGHTGNLSRRGYLYQKFNTPLRGHEKWKAIVNEIAQEYDIDPTELIGPSTRHYIARARHRCMARIRSEVMFRGEPASLTRIGMWMGNRHHTTVLYAIEKYGEVNAV